MASQYSFRRRRHRALCGKPYEAPSRLSVDCEVGSSQNMFYVYILRSIAIPAKTYIGVTEDLKKRLAEHNTNTQPHTSKYSPWAIETYIAFSSKDKAFSFERYLKAGSGKAFLNKRLINDNK